ncbi:hypothetical protein SAY86_000570 [Trapa natans]|uniref:BZIP domain-containing protein n=1 Tax=Trapa natans TaxID=22666 RepID=A0AAN7RFS4_TRANT|nr:hypothetical protein SAY86_000570 [Trapa natans]
MGNQEDAKSTKSEKPSTPQALEQSHIHVYPNWAAAQAYYGPRVALPPYYNSTVPPGYAPHPYFWSPQHIISPYGTPYAATYSQGGVYAHPATPTIPAPVSGETPSKSSGGPSHYLTVKKSIDKLAIVESGDNGAKPRVLESTESEDTSDSRDVHTSGAYKLGRKRMRNGTPHTTLRKCEGGSALDANLKIPSEGWLLSERDLKWERRKQSNRESARRSRLRKQAEAEELANKVGYLTAENAALTTEINRMIEDADNLRRENAKLMENLKHSKPEGTGDEGSDTEIQETLPIATENLLTRVENVSSSEASTEEKVYNQKVQNIKSGTKLLQLFTTKSRGADAVSAA